MTLTVRDLPRLKEMGVKVPKFDRYQVTPGVVHIGPSHFARGHVLRFFNRILKDDLRWGVRAISLQTPNVRDTLREQDYLYTVSEQRADKVKSRVIGSLIDVTVAQEDPRAALDVLCDPQIKLVTITVTQNGYGHDPATGNLDFSRSDIQECLSNMDAPSTTVGYLVAALERRMKEGAPPLTIMSCDNMPDNGVVLRNVVLTYAAEKSRELRSYIEDNITFPSTMVDRIVPTTTNTDVFNVKGKGIEDEWPILTERFKQWVIEDNFAGEVPDFASAGAIVTNNVASYELMKLRMLNGAHMALGCVAGLAGEKYVDEAMQNLQLKKFIQGFMDEASLTVPRIEGVDFRLYKEQLIERLENPHMKDELVRLARNGTGKIKGRVLDTLIDAKASEIPHEHLSFATASWVQYLKGYDDRGSFIDINDSKAIDTGLQRIAQNSNGNPLPIMEASGLFRSLTKDQVFVRDVQRHLHNIQRHGVLGALNRIGVPEIKRQRQMGTQIS
jgi:fructuronate reductase